MIERVGIVGLGYISGYHAAAIRRAAPAAEVIGVDLSAAVRRHAELTGDVASTVASIDELIALRPQVVHVLTPPHQHATVALPLLAAGIDVLLEKPLAATTAECAAIAEAAAASGAVVGVGHNQLFYEIWGRARRMIVAGDLGAVRSVDLVARRPLGFLRAGDLRPWLMRGATNVLFEVAPHAFAQVLDVVPDVEVHSVRTGSRQQLANGVSFVRQWDILGAAGDVGVRISLSYEDAMSESSIAVRGTLGSLTADFDRNTLTGIRRGFAPFDLELFEQVAGGAAAAAGGAVSTLAKVVAGKAGAGKYSDPFTGSIRRSVAAFYEGTRTRVVDDRQAMPFSTRVVALAEAVAQASGLTAELPSATAVTTTAAVAEPASPSAGPAALVVGGTGFIGSHLVRRLASTQPVRVVARDADRAALQFAGLDVEVVSGDARDTERLMSYVDDDMVVYHLAFGGASTWAELEADDLEPTLRFAKACMARGIRRFVYTSTIAVYDAGKPGETITEATRPSKGVLRVAPYARAKAEAEEALSEMFRTTGFPVVIARPGVVLGVESDPCHWGVAAWRHPNVAIHWGSGRNPMPVVLVEDVADALVRMGETAEIEGESFNLCVDAQLTAEDYLEELSRASGSLVRRRANRSASLYVSAVAKWLMKLPGGSRVPFPSYADCAGRSFASRFDCTKAQRVLGWTPEQRHDEVLRRGVTEPAVAWTR